MERERLVATLGEQEDEDTRKLISNRLKTLAEEIKQIDADIKAEERLYQEPEEQRDALRRLVEWGKRKHEELKEASIEDKRQVLLWLRTQVKVWKTDHQPPFEVYLFASGDASPLLLERGSGDASGSGNAHLSKNIMPTTSAPCRRSSNCGKIILPSL